MDFSRREFVTGLSALLGLEIAGCSTATTLSKPTIARPIASPPMYQGRGKALIVNGDAYGFVHTQNVVRATKFLLGIGYTPDEITILSTPYESLAHKEQTILRTTAFQQEFQLPQIAGPATTRNVETALEKILSGPTIPELFIYITGHGEEEGKSSHIGLNQQVDEKNSDKLVDLDLARWLERGNFVNGIVIADGCNGEGFAQNIGSAKVTAFAKSKYGQADPCAFFTENFFNSPWRQEADQDQNRILTLQEALLYTQNYLQEGKAKAEFTIYGSAYNPSLRPTGQYTSFWQGTFPVPLPGSGIEFVGDPPDSFMFGKYYKRAVYVDSQKKMKKALQDKNARFYFMAEGCSPCARLRPYIKEILEETQSLQYPKVYVVPAYFNTDEKKFKHSSKWAEEVSTVLDVGRGWPRFVKRVDGKITLNELGIPEQPYTYGNLPDKSVLGISKELLKVYLT